MRSFGCTPYLVLKPSGCGRCLKVARSIPLRHTLNVVPLDASGCKSSRSPGELATIPDACRAIQDVTQRWYSFLGSKLLARGGYIPNGSRRYGFRKLLAYHTDSG